MHIVVKDGSNVRNVTKDGDSFEFTATDSATVELASFAYQLRICNFEDEYQTCDVVPRDWLIKVRSGNTEIRSAFEAKMTLFLLRGGNLARFASNTAIDIKRLSSIRDSPMIESWIVDEDWPVQLVVPGYLWKNRQGQFATRLETRIDRNDLVLQELQINLRAKSPNNKTRKRDPVYWALGSEKLLETSTPQLEEPIAQLASYLLQPEKTIWSDYLPKVARVASMGGMDKVLDTKQSDPDIRRLHISAAASLLLAQSSVSGRVENLKRACQRASNAWFSLFDLVGPFPQRDRDAKEKLNTSEFFKGSQLDPKRRADDPAMALVYLDISLLQTEACFCANLVNAEDVRRTIGDMKPLANKLSRSEYEEALYDLENALRPHRAATFCGINSRIVRPEDRVHKTSPRRSGHAS
jgi:hypothetical protein